MSDNKTMTAPAPHGARPPASGRAALRRPLAAICLCAGTLWSGAAVAQQQSPEQMAQALSRAQALLRQVAEQRQRLETENAEMKAKLAGVEKKLKVTMKKLEDAEADLASEERENTRLDKRLESTRSRLDKTEDKLREVIDKYRQLAQKQRQTEAERQRLASDLEVTRKELDTAEQHNIKLIEANRELMDLYESKSAWEALAQREPVTGLEQVEIENILQEYEDLLYKQEYLRPDSGPAAAGAGAAAEAN